MELISVVVCTYNRSASLAETLERLAALQTDGTFEIEVVVVDNNSSDDTRQVVAGWEPRFGGRLRYVFEGRQGLSFARNAGVAAARGQLLVFTDDDVQPEPDWLRQLEAVRRQFDADCVYGKVVPRWLAPPPAWLGPAFLRPLAMVDRGEQPFVVTSPSDQFVGASMAFSRQVLDRVGGFNVALGNRGDGLGGEEDTELFERLLASGARIVYTPRAVVHHAVPVDRMQPGYFRRWYFAHGATAARLPAYRSGQGLLGLPWWVLRKFLEETARWVASLGTGSSERRLSQQMKVLFYLGLFAERMRGPRREKA